MQKGHRRKHTQRLPCMELCVCVEYAVCISRVVVTGPQGLFFFLSLYVFFFILFYVSFFLCAILAITLVFVSRFVFSRMVGRGKRTDEKCAKGNYLS